jgi:hypothetical protein
LRRNQRLSSCGASSTRGEHHSRPRALVPSCRTLQACCATGLPRLKNCGASACVRTATRWSFFRRTVPARSRGAHPHGFGFYERFGEQGSTARASAQSREPSAGRKRSPENRPGAVGYSSIAITMDVYSHVMPNMQAEAAAKVDAALKAAQKNGS